MCSGPGSLSGLTPEEKQQWQELIASNPYSNHVVAEALVEVMTETFSLFFVLTLKAPITIAADDIHKYFFIVFQRNKT